MDIAMTPVGRVVSTRAEVRHDDWDAETAEIRLDPAQVGPDALAGLADFSHAEILFHFDRVAPDAVERDARRPRGNPAWPRVGVFAQRGKNRPNRIGATIVRVIAVDGLTLRVAGLDAVDGTPVLDIKPFMREFGPRGDVAQPSWATEVMRAYWSDADATGAS